MWDYFIIICLENIGIFTKLFLFPWVICPLKLKKIVRDSSSSVLLSYRTSIRYAERYMWNIDDKTIMVMIFSFNFPTFSISLFSFLKSPLKQ